jgi:hypothetical protein
MRRNWSICLELVYTQGPAGQIRLYSTINKPPIKVGMSGLIPNIAIATRVGRDLRHGSSLFFPDLSQTKFVL